MSLNEKFEHFVEKSSYGAFFLVLLILAILNIFFDFETITFITILLFVGFSILFFKIDLIHKELQSFKKENKDY